MFKGWSRTKFLSIYPLPALLTTLPIIPFTTEEFTGCPNEEIGLLFFISYFTVSVTLSMNMPESSKDFMILIISFISSFEINKVNLFPDLRASFPLIFLSKLFIAFEAKLFNNPGELSLAKGIAFASAFLPKLANQEPKDSPY